MPKRFRSIIDSGNKTLIYGSLVPEVEVNAKGLIGDPIKMYLSNEPLMDADEIRNHYQLNN
jgi:hypothetical protein